MICGDSILKLNLQKKIPFADVEDIKKESVTLLAVAPIEIQLKYKRVCEKERDEESVELSRISELHNGDMLLMLIYPVYICFVLAP